MTNITTGRNNRGKVFRTLLKERLLNLVDEYCDEGEHQDGQEYWDQFDNLEQAYQDLILYAQGKIDQD